MSCQRGSCVSTATVDCLPLRPTQSSRNLEFDPTYHTQSPQRIFDVLSLATFLTTFGTWPGILHQREARRMLSNSGAVTKFFFALDENPPLKNSEA
jgi:hypothetical protein